MAYWIVNGKQLTDKEYEEHQRRQMEEQEGIRQRADALVQKLGQTYDELTRLLEQNPEVGRQVTERTAKDEEVYRRLRQRLELADAAPRCRWIKQDGTACGSPQMRKHIYCFAHRQMMEARALALRLPALEDANAIQIGLMRVQKALIEDTITTKKAGLLLYSMQLALMNVGQTTFGQAKDEELVRETMDEEEAFSENQGLPLMNTDDTDRNPTPLKHRGTEEAEEHIYRGSTRMNADECGLESGRKGLAKIRGDSFLEELPKSAITLDTLSGSFDAPSLAPRAPACSG